MLQAPQMVSNFRTTPAISGLKRYVHPTLLCAFHSPLTASSMLLSPIFSSSNILFGITVSFVSLAVYCLGCGIYNRYFHPYSKYPGPFWASITPLWYWRAVRYGRGQDHQLPIHKKYGDFVRIAPNEIQIMDPAAIETIYGPKTVFNKADFYAGFDPAISPRHGLFEEQDEKKHNIRRRIVAPLYTQGSILEFEPCVDRLIALFYRQMERFGDDDKVFDMSEWLRKYTFDVVGEIFYGKIGGFGFIRENIDYNNWCKLMDTMPRPAAAKTYVPWGFQTLFFLSEFASATTRVGAKGFFDVITQSHDAVKERLAETNHNYKDSKGTERIDMLTRLLELVNDNPDPKVHWTIKDVTAEIWTVIWAGSDTTSIALTSIFYHLHRHPATLSKLRTEIEEALSNGALTYPFRYADCVKLPYLHAVVREGMRVHASLGTGLPRIVPKEGSIICGRSFPANGGVIMNAMAVNFHKPTFGEDAEEFVPERWLRDGKQRADKMERAMLQFGYGPRICIGKHITNTEMYKLLPTILRDFEFTFQHDRMPNTGPNGEKGWTVFSGWFHQQKDVWVKVERRREKVKGERVHVEINMDEGEEGWGRKRN